MSNITSKKMRKLAKFCAPALLLSLSACATPFRADVARFQELPAPTGQSFVIMAADPDLAGSLEFAHYAKTVENQMKQVGYVNAADPSSADMVVSFAYGRDKGKERRRQTFSPYFGGGFYNSRFGYSPRHYYGRRYRGYYRSNFILGFHDPFLYSGFGFNGYGGEQVVTIYTSNIDLKIDRVSDNKRLFEGKAEAKSRAKNLGYLVPNLVEAMFTGFPGNSGETVRISIAPEKKRKR